MQRRNTKIKVESTHIQTIARSPQYVKMIQEFVKNFDDKVRKESMRGCMRRCYIMRRARACSYMSYACVYISHVDTPILCTCHEHVLHISFICLYMPHPHVLYMSAVHVLLRVPHVCPCSPLTHMLSFSSLISSPTSVRNPSPHTIVISPTCLHGWTIMGSIARRRVCSIAMRCSVDESIT